MSVIKDTEGTRVGIFDKMLEERILFVVDVIDDNLANSIVAHLLYLNSKDSKKPITLYINSPGGSIASGMAIYDAMKLVKAPVNTIGFGMCASMGSFLLSMGDKRSVLPNTTIMIHQPLSGVEGQQTEIEITAERVKKLRKKLETMYAEKSDGKTTYEEIHKACERDNYLDPEDALKMGLIDEIIGGEG